MAGGGGEASLQSPPLPCREGGRGIGQRKIVIKSINRTMVHNQQSQKIAVVEDKYETG
jgi:hypothetical protein